MYYRLSPEYELCGYKGLPFALFNRRTCQTEYFKRDQYALVLQCDGRHDMNIDELSEESRTLFDNMLGKGIITPCENGEQIAPRQEYRRFDNYAKETVHWSLTGNCNYRCKHCFMSAPEARFGHPATEQLLKLVEQFAECGIRSAGLTGGEPLIRSDFFTIVDALLDHGIAVSTIYSNGRLITEQLLDELEKRGIHPAFQLSFDGVDGMHDWLRGIPGAEDEVLRAMSLLKSRGFYFTCSMVLHKNNRHQIRASVRKLAEYGCSSLKINRSFEMGEWEKYGNFALSLEEYLEVLLAYIPQYLEDGTPISLMLDGYFHYQCGAEYAIVTAEKNATGGDSVCSSMRKNMYVSPEGKVLPCMSMIGTAIAETFPDVFETPLREILTESTYCTAMRCNMKEYYEHNPECRKCEYASRCAGGCRSQAMSNGSMDFLSPEKTLCRFFKEGWYDRFRAAIDLFNQGLAERKAAEETLLR